MTDRFSFASPLAASIVSYLEFKRALGRQYRTEGRVLHVLDQSLAGRGLDSRLSALRTGV
jgi:hypothetical protein